MDWDQIENKWAAMTRRIRADWTVNQDEGNPVTGRRSSILNVTAQPVASLQTASLQSDAAPEMAVE